MKDVKQRSSHFYVHVGWPAYKELELGRLASQGYQVLILDDLGTRPPEGLFHTYRYDPDRSVPHLAREIRSFAESSGLTLAGLFTLCECSVDTLNDLCKEFQLNPVFTRSLESIRDKHAMRKRLEEEGYLLPYLHKATCAEEIPSPAPSFFPLIVKPIDSLDSRSVSKVHNQAELVVACRKVFSSDTHLPTDHGPVSIEKMYGMKPHAVIETYVEGYEYSVEAIVVQGILRNQFVTYKRNSGAPFFYEHGHTAGLESLTMEQQRQLGLLLQSLIKVNGYDSTILHVEFRVTQAGEIFLIECNSRLCGDQIAELIDKAYDVNLLDAFFRYLDGETENAFPKKALRLASRLYLTSEREGKLRIRQSTIAGFPVDWWKKEGDLVRHVATQGATRVGAVSFCAKDAAELEAIEKRFLLEQSQAFHVAETKVAGLSEFLSRRIRRLYFWALALLSVVLIGGTTVIQLRESETLIWTLGKNVSSALLEDVVNAEILPIAQKLRSLGFLTLTKSVTVTDRDLSALYSSNEKGLPHFPVFRPVNPHEFEFRVPIESDGVLHGYLLFNRNPWQIWAPIFSTASVILATLLLLYWIITHRIIPGAIQTTSESIRKISSVVIGLSTELGKILNRQSEHDFSFLEKAQEELSTMKVEVAEVRELREITSSIVTATRRLGDEIREKGALTLKYDELSQSVLLEKARQKAIEEVSRQVAHDIRSPLTALKLATQDLKELPEGIRVLIQAATARINGIANDLLVGYKTVGPISARPLTVQPVLIVSLVRSLLSEKRVQFVGKPDVEIVSDLPVSFQGTFVSAHHADLVRVVSNILNNAMEAIPGKGTVTVRLRQEGQTLALEVRDSGKGILPEHLPLLGKETFTHDKRGGSGFGIYHARGYLQSIGGGLNITSQPGVGTVVTLLLPLVATPSWFAQEIAVEDFSTIAVLDDDDSVHKIWDERFSSFSEKRGVRLRHFHTSAALIDWHAGAHSEKTLFLLDQELQGDPLNGIKIAERLNILDRTVIVTSRNDENDVIQQCEKLGLKMLPKMLAGDVSIRFNA